MTYNNFKHLLTYILEENKIKDVKYIKSYLTQINNTQWDFKFDNGIIVLDLTICLAKKTSTFNFKEEVTEELGSAIENSSILFTFNYEDSNKLNNLLTKVEKNKEESNKTLRESFFQFLETSYGG